MATMKENLGNNTPPLAIHLFGSVEILVHGAPLARLRSRKGVWLLVWLTLRKGKPIERDWLVGTLWPDSSQSQALAYLRHCLTELRHALGTEAVRLQSPTRQTLALDLAGAEVDVLTFDAGIQQGDPAALQRAVAVYKGPLLEDCHEDWALLERGNREQSYLTALQCLADAALARAEVEAAIQFSRRIIGVDPLQEGAQRTLIQALVSAGDYGAATQVYRELRLHLHRELNTEPDPQTTALYNKLRARTRQKARVASDVSPNQSTNQPLLPAPRRLPHPLTDLVGREEEVIEIAARLRQRRLVTLTGIGGVGKTRLAIAVAEALVDEYTDGAWFVDLAAVSDIHMVLPSVAAALEVHDEPGGSLGDSLVKFLRSRLLLLVLDNCEHLLQVCASLAEDLLQNCSGVRVLATSRQAFGVAGEVNWQVSTLPVPTRANLPADAASQLSAVSRYPSVQLFVERAEAMQKAFMLTDGNALAVAGICERLDGIPLAIELAAGNVRALSVEQIARRLDDVFRLLMRGSSTALPRQRTLRATLDWSYDLLTEQERYLLQRLSVFAGGWTLEASEQICSSQTDGARSESSPVLETEDVFDVITSLVDKSLVQFDAVQFERNGGARYRLLETVRQYAAERLNENGQAERTKRCHRDYFLAFAEQAERNLAGPDQAQWLDRLECDHDNLRLALSGCGADVTGLLGLRFATALSEFWICRGYIVEGRGRIAQAIEHYISLGPHATASTIVARAHTALGILDYRQSDYTTAARHFECALETARQIGAPKQEALLLKLMGNIAYDQGRLEAARDLYQSSLILYRRLEDRLSEAHVLDSLGNVAHADGNYILARSLREEALALMRDSQDAGSLCVTLHNLGNTARAMGDVEVALTRFHESLALARAIGKRSTIAYNLCHLAEIEMHRNDYTLAAPLLHESLSLFYELGQKEMIAELFETYAELAMLQADLPKCACLNGAATALREEIGVPLTGPDLARHGQMMSRVREALGPDFSNFHASGRAMSLDRAFALARQPFKTDTDQNRH